MAELPEIMILTRQISHKLEGKEFESVEIIQEKSLNMEKTDFIENILSKKVICAYNRGKWIFLELSGDSNLLLNLGMGADILFHNAGKEWPDKYQCRFQFNDQSGFSCKFWWFGHVEFVPNEDLNQHKPTKDIAISPLDTNFTEEHFTNLIKGRSQIKNLILNQKKIGGIGNVYIHDILFKAKIHPQRLANSLTSQEINDIYRIMVENLKNALDKGGLAYEMDFYGVKEGYTIDDFLVAYKEGEPCPVCSAIIEKIKTGSTSSYICPQCQCL
ncbi:MAG: formamidopyrimidine-DNA glycosylase [Methanobacterium sp. ERen5]|nr:MAG: formamidopyrimidine-DNA glycosylase [Methanobacterium sp. ERen5]